MAIKKYYHDTILFTQNSCGFIATMQELVHSFLVGPGSCVKYIKGNYPKHALLFNSGKKIKRLHSQYDHARTSGIAIWKPQEGKLPHHSNTVKGSTSTVKTPPIYSKHRGLYP